MRSASRVGGSSNALDSAESSSSESDEERADPKGM